MQVALTMAVAHGGGIVHRDLKPDNLFVISDPAMPGGERIKILDFGIAKLAAEEGSSPKTQTGAILGTPMYMSPEQCRGAGRVDHRTDVYALGAVLSHLVCGRPPFVADSAADLIAAHLLEEPQPPSATLATVPPAVDAIVKKCLEKSADDRYATMSELARALASVSGSRISIEIIAPSSRSEMSPMTAPIRASASRSIGLATTLGTSAGQTHRASVRRTRWLAVVAALGIACVATIAILVGSSPTAHTTAPAQPSDAVAAVIDGQLDAASDVAAAIDVAPPLDAAPVAVDARSTPIDAPARRRPAVTPNGSGDDMYDVRDRPKRRSGD
jgi:serine/threonine-protein kinase